VDKVVSMDSHQIRLCSQSESRASILRQAGISFIQSPVDYDDMPRKEIFLGGRS